MENFYHFRTQWWQNNWWWCTLPQTWDSCANLQTDPRETPGFRASQPARTCFDQRQEAHIHLRTSMLPGKPRVYPCQEHASQGRCWINGDKEEKVMIKDQWGPAARSNCTLSWSLFVQVQGQPTLKRRGFPLAWPGHVQFGHDTLWLSQSQVC